MTFRVIILPQAHRDIDRNADWWADPHSVEQAVRCADTVYDQIETLADSPESNSLSAENDEFPYEIRDKLFGLDSRPGYPDIFREVLRQRSLLGEALSGSRSAAQQAGWTNTPITCRIGCRPESSATFQRSVG